MAYAAVALVALVALARGGYAAWGILALELGSAVLLVWAVLDVIRRTPAQERERNRLRSKRSADVDIVAPGESFENASLPRDRYLFISGFPFRRTGLLLPLVLLSLWVASSLVPLDSQILSRLSPTASALRDGAPGPISLAPFVTLRSLWIGLSWFALVFVGAHIASSSRRAERFSQLLFFLGVGFGVFGMTQWLFGLQELFGRDPTTASLRASASFGNRNHYAFFMEMLLLVGAGWAISKRRELAERLRSRGGVRELQELGGRLFFLGLGLVLIALGLLFSLSRSGIAFGFVGAAILVVLVSSRASGSERGRLSRALLLLLLAGLALGSWIGLDPVVHRFRLVPGEWEAELGRARVWEDSLGAVRDFKLTGSGLSTFRYLYPSYRSFGGNVAYSWAHNDYLQVLIELGVPGLLVLLWVLAIFFRRAASNLGRFRNDWRLRPIHAGYVAALVAVALHSMTDFGLHLAANGALASLLVGAAVGLDSRRGGRVGREQPAEERVDPNAR